jgi:hypothetical protein
MRVYLNEVASVQRGREDKGRKLALSVTDTRQEENSAYPVNCCSRAPDKKRPTTDPAASLVDWLHDIHHYNHQMS